MHFSQPVFSEACFNVSKHVELLVSILFSISFRNRQNMRTLSILSNIFLYMAYIFQCSNVSLKQNACLGISAGFLHL